MTNHQYCVLAAALLMAGCVPAVVTYYEPSAHSGAVINDTCGAVAPSDTLKLEVHSADLRVTGSAHSLTLTFRVPKGSTVKAKSTEVAVSAGNDTKTYTLSEFSYYDRDKRQTIKVAAREPLVGADENFVVGDEPRIFQAWLQLESASETYQVHLPAIVVDGTTVELPVITFTRKSGFGVYPVNC